MEGVLRQNADKNHREMSKVMFNRYCVRDHLKIPFQLLNFFIEFYRIYSFCTNELLKELERFF